jgi:hypothetical protein
MLRALQHDSEKWVPVFGKRSCSNNKLERDDDSKKSHPALAGAKACGKSKCDRRVASPIPSSSYCGADAGRHVGCGRKPGEICGAQFYVGEWRSFDARTRQVVDQRRELVRAQRYCEFRTKPTSLCCPAAVPPGPLILVYGRAFGVFVLSFAGHCSEIGGSACSLPVMRSVVMA